MQVGKTHFLVISFSKENHEASIYEFCEGNMSLKAGAQLHRKKCNCWLSLMQGCVICTIFCIILATLHEGESIITFSTVQLDGCAGKTLSIHYWKKMSKLALMHKRPQPQCYLKILVLLKRKSLLHYYGIFYSVLFSYTVLARK